MGLVAAYPEPSGWTWVSRLKRTTLPFTRSPRVRRFSSESVSLTSATIPPGGVGRLIPTAVATTGRSTGVRIVTVSSPRTQCGTVTGSPRTFASPSRRNSSRAQATAASAPGEPDRRGPIRSVSQVSLVQAPLRESASLRRREATSASAAGDAGGAAAAAGGGAVAGLRDATAIGVELMAIGAEAAASSTSAGAPTTRDTKWTRARCACRRMDMDADDRMRARFPQTEVSMQPPLPPAPRAGARLARGPAVLVLLGAAATATSAAAPAAPAANPSAAPRAADREWRWTPEAIVDTVRVEDAAISPDGRQVVFGATRPRPDGAAPGEAYLNLWRVAAEGGARHRLTSADARDDDPAWSPDGATIAFRSARGGEKAKKRLWVIPASGGEPVALTSEKDEVERFAWSPDGTRIAYVAIDPKSEAREKEEKAGRDW